MENEIIELNKNISSVEGYITKNEAELLYNLAKNCEGNGVVVEIGSFKGKSTICLAKGSKAGNKIQIFAIDPHTGTLWKKSQTNSKIWTFDEFKENIKKADIDDIVTPIIKVSEDAVKDFLEPVELIFIDGDHDYDFVKLDFDLWFPKIINGGIMAFHDANWPGPKKVVGKFICNSKYFRNIGFVDALAYGEKINKNSIRDRLKNLYIFIRWDNQSLIETILGAFPKKFRSFGKNFVKKILK